MIYQYYLCSLNEEKMKLLTAGCNTLIGGNELTSNSNLKVLEN